ncbi:uncharacterized protein LOC131657058 [Vicia villosa]|uniref:uncharacterized protein LOC131657058 n=1 Tax=Vicia villosa TaxID=3911 RepID=UPI00273C1461|nr:uncharacterized protein LOC131657058 [Vicia villosa]
MYAGMMKDNLNVDWQGVLKWNNARPRALITLWLLCHGKPATKDRMIRFGLITESICSMCKEADESINHIFFECRVTNKIWKTTLGWMNIDRDPKGWNAELEWIDENTKKKGWKSSILKMACAEAVYEILSYRNAIVFKKYTQYSVIDRILDNIVYRSWMSQKHRKYIA